MESKRLAKRLFFRAAVFLWIIFFATALSIFLMANRSSSASASPDSAFDTTDLILELISDLIPLFLIRLFSF